MNISLHLSARVLNGLRIVVGVLNIGVMLIFSVSLYLTQQVRESDDSEFVHKVQIHTDHTYTVSADASISQLDWDSYSPQVSGGPTECPFHTDRISYCQSTGTRHRRFTGSFSMDSESATR